MQEYALLTETGKREINEDAIGAYKNGENFGFIVCDGLGGHGMGDIAAQCVRDAFKESFCSAKSAESSIEAAFNEGQRILSEKQAKLHAGKKMKTTAVAVVTDEKKAYIGHVGDSRAYVFYKNKIRVRTLDHSIPQMLVLSKQIKESEIRNHPDRNILIRVMGTEWEKPMYELMKPIDLKKCQAFLLCTDGFWELIEEDTMCRLLKESESPEDWLNRMKDEVLANGLGRNTDNFSAIAVWNK